ncbi:hypothetical protein [Komagataeibacter sp. FNDCR2]|uniref:hypothetical protein n=1 Tax=Komagataeibacter sp. FNDCR2 TaxID=2878682 RepID=UPI001E447D77|nr:hypothetical protein [Komagataeibacter sp. FNDCR2]MCE2576729.1 hypothetical protein [Komagataeibacter sp. FNDCR2]
MKKYGHRVVVMAALFLGATGPGAFAESTGTPDGVARAVTTSGHARSQSLAAQYHEIAEAGQKRVHSENDAKARSSLPAYPVMKISYSVLATRPQGYRLRSFSVTAQSDADNRHQGFILTDDDDAGIASHDPAKPVYTGEAHMGDSTGRLVIEALWRNGKHGELRCTIVQHYTNTIGSHAITMEPGCGELTSTVTGLWGQDRNSVPDEKTPDTNIPQHA